MNKDSLYRVTYRSKLKKDVNIKAIIRKSNEYNNEVNISGALWCDKKTGDVRQVLEGERATVQHLLGKIKADLRHESFVLEAEEFPRSRAFHKWGGMALATDPDFENSDMTMKPEIFRQRMSYSVDPQNVKMVINNVIQNQADRVGGLMYISETTGEVIEYLEGDKAELDYIATCYNLDSWMTNIKPTKAEKVEKRQFTIFEGNFVSQYVSRDDGSHKGERAQISLDGVTYETRLFNMFETGTGITQTVLLFMCEDSKAKSQPVPLAKLVKMIEDLFRSRLPSQSADGKSSAAASSGSSCSLVNPPPFQFNEFTFACKRVMGFRIRKRWDRACNEVNKGGNFAVIPTTNAELKGTIPRGSVLTRVNGVDVTKPDMSFQKLCSMIKDVKQKVGELKITVAIKSASSRKEEEGQEDEDFDEDAEELTIYD